MNDANTPIQTSIPHLYPKSKQAQSPHAPVLRPKSQGQLLLELIAISGEYPAENIHRIIPSSSYSKKLVSALIADKLIKLVNKGGIRGFRLEIKGKRKLMTENPARFGDYLEGSADTNKLRSDLPRRLRLHFAAEVFTLMYNAEIRVFKDTKPPLYALCTHAELSQPSNESIAITTPCFYSSREQKQDDDKSNAIRGARAAGTLLTPTHVYAIYNTGGVESRWRESVELRYKEDVQDYICRKTLPYQYNGMTVGGIMIGHDLEILERYLVAKTKTSSGHSFLAQSYQPFYFITNDNYGEAQLRLICDSARKAALNTAMQKGLLPMDSKYPIEHDALTKDGNPVLFCCLLNIPRLMKFRTGCILHSKPGMAIAFDFQREMLGRYLGGGIEIKSISLEKLIKRLYPVGSAYA
jgi:hypothetical protein